MQKATKIVTLIALIFLLMATVSFADYKKSELPAYLLSIFIGFGTGHFYAGDGNGSLFLIGDIAGYGIMVAGVVVMFAFMNPFGTSFTSIFTGLYIGYGLIGVGSVALLIFRIWEIADIFRAVDRGKNEGRIASNSIQFQIAPTGFQFRYSF